MPEAVLLVHARTDAAWFHDAVRVAAAACFTLGRIRFETPEGTGDSPTSGSAFLYFGDRPDRFARVFGGYGSVVRNYAAETMPRGEQAVTGPNSRVLLAPGQ